MRLCLLKVWVYEHIFSLKNQFQKCFNCKKFVKKNIHVQQQEEMNICFWQEKIKTVFCTDLQLPGSPY